MPLNSLKVNDDKTEFLPIHSKFLKSTPSTPIQIGNVEIDTTPSARNLGSFFDNALTLEPHINTVCKSAYFHIQQISHIQKHLTLQATKTISHSLILLQLDYCNSVLARVPDSSTYPLQGPCPHLKSPTWLFPCQHIIPPSPI